MVIFLYVLVISLLARCSASPASNTIELSVDWVKKYLKLPNGEIRPSFMVGETFRVHISSNKRTWPKIRCHPEGQYENLYYIDLKTLNIDTDTYEYIIKETVIITGYKTGSWKCTAYSAENSDSIYFFFNVVATNAKQEPSSSSDTNKCHDNTCHVFANCTNTVSSFLCSCLQGYMGDGFNCTDINECEERNYYACSTNAYCHNLPGSFYCSCITGYKGNAYLKNGCVDVNECENPDICRAFPGSMCINNPGSYNCSCPEGYVYRDQIIGCTYPNDACMPNPCGINTLCESSLGSARCSCPKGFQDDPTKKCHDVGPENLFSTTCLFGIIGVTLMVVILAVWMIVGIYKRKRRHEQAVASDINYNNLDDEPLPTPPQWDVYSNPADVNDTYIYTVPYVENNIEEMYAKPQPKHQRQPANEILPLYAEVDVVGEPNYASLEPKGDQGPKTNYAKLRHHMPVYGQIQLKKLKDSKQCTPQVLPKLNEENYAQVLPKSLRKPFEAPKYSKTVEGRHYVNAEVKGQFRDDYAEPAYCEVNLKK